MAFPLMVYRPGKGVMLGETECETLTVADEEELEIAASDGWKSADDILIGAHDVMPAPEPKKRGRPRKVKDDE